MSENISNEMRKIFSVTNFNLIKNLFAEEEWNVMNKELTNHENSLTEDDISFDTTSEKCWNFLEEFWVTSYDPSPLLDYIRISSTINTKKVPGYMYQSLAVKIRDNKLYYNLFCSTLSIEERKQFDKMLKVLLTGEEIHDDDLLAKYNLSNPNTQYNLMLFGRAALLDTNHIYTRKKTIKASELVKKFHVQYNHFIQQVNDDLFKIYEVTSAASVFQIAAIQNVLSYFRLYYLLYDKNWKNHLWGQYFDQIIIKHQREAFLNYLRNNNDPTMVNEFCDEMEDYYNSKNLPLPFDLSTFPNRTIYESDTDESHKGWFEKIPEVKYNGVANHLYRNLCNLYDRLVEKGWIEKGKKSLFTYRLSGYNFQFNLSYDEEIKWSGSDRELGFLILALYNHYDNVHDKVVSPQYKKIQKYFGVKSNIRIVLDLCISNKTWFRIKGMLEDCGFTSLEPIKDD